MKYLITIIAIFLFCFSANAETVKERRARHKTTNISTENGLIRICNLNDPAIVKIKEILTAAGKKQVGKNAVLYVQNGLSTVIVKPNLPTPIDIKDELKELKVRVKALEEAKK